MGYLRGCTNTPMVRAVPILLALCAAALLLFAVSPGCNSPTGDVSSTERRGSVPERNTGMISVARSPEVVTLGILAQSYLPVTFTHSAHVKIAESCVTCHHHSVGQNGTPLCRSCHTQPFQDQERPGLKGAYHRQCMNCHQATGKGPLTCDGCHKKK